jgi:lysozyme family protein
MTDLFPIALAFVLLKEGGAKITDDPDDPGGLTKYGISQRAYPHLDIRNLSESQASAIYRADYWTPAGCAQVPGAIGIMLFDIAVNQGQGTAVKLLQEAAGVLADGKLGAKTVEAVNRKHPRDMLREFTVRRQMRYSTTRNFEKFGLGWNRRAVECLCVCLDNLE